MIDSAIDWLANFDGYQVKVPEEHEESIVEVTYVYKNKEQLKAAVRDLEDALKKLEKNVGTKGSEGLRNLRNSIDAIKGDTYLNKI